MTPEQQNRLKRVEVEVAQLRAIEQRLDEILRQLVGSKEWAEDGLVLEVKKLKQKVQDLQNWKRDLRMYVLGIATCFTALGTALGWLFQK